jgi:hypothetical protein
MPCNLRYVTLTASAMFALLQTPFLSLGDMASLLECVELRRKDFYEVDS